MFARMGSWEDKAGIQRKEVRDRGAASWDGALSPRRADTALIGRPSE